MTIDKISYEEFRNEFYTKVINKVTKMRMRMVNLLGVRLWEDIGPEKAIKQVFNDQIKLSCHEEVMDYLTLICDQKLDWEKPLWEIRVVENYQDDTSLIIYKFHHCFMDGVGFASIMS